jgi:hypothetical protein
MMETRFEKIDTMAVTELKCDDDRNFGKTDSIPRENAYLVALQLRACPDHDLYFELDRTLSRARLRHAADGAK